MFTKRKRKNEFQCLLESKKKRSVRLDLGARVGAVVGSSEGLSKEGMIELCLNLKDDSQWERRAGAETKAWR